MTGFSRRPEDVATARRFLVSRVDEQEDRLPTYGDVAATYGGIARAVGPVLNSIARDCQAAEQPDLTALVVHHRTRRPRSFEGQAVEPNTRGEQRWRGELDKIRRYEWPGTLT